MNSRAPSTTKEPDALVDLKGKLEEEKARHAHMIAVNRYFRERGTVNGCEGVGSCEKAMIEGRLKMGDHSPFLPWQFSSSKDRIRRLQARIRDAETAIAAGSQPVKVEGLPGVTYYENGALMRVQLTFENDPGPEVRGILKGNAFRWSYSQRAWQRILNENGKRAAQKALAEIKMVQAVGAA
ncbi:hypothetical protein [Faecalibacterium sp. 9]|uniref:hypothetical protein n=1 Tax=unclassified Faecalibacterium TaxID=2646395 RepID=UPI003AACB743